LLQVVIAVWVVVGAVPASADIVFNQVPNQSGGFPSDTDYLFFGQPNQWQRMADGFQLAAPGQLTQVVFWGFFYDAFYAPDQETMRVRFLGARETDGLPDENAVLYSETFQNPTREATGQQVIVGPGPPEYRYTIDLSSPLLVSANTKYWLEVVQIGDPASDFACETARTTSPQDVVAGNNALHPNWDYVGPRVSLAFQLWVPEPSALGCIVMSFLMYSRRRGQRSIRARSR
jgi:hypothetical protein